ncbi:hypothetical protein [Microbacterium allomyrinae]|uniref:Uncharacterized protein n=1 Tax=Microbacterium allomyrinae TaxID=2830666 RepID=A0A9X1S1W9_9MICO|nr:hypothetical protein [Microbacterium allomyrinae]MCC2030645.1 hypothetical protein [Microbacterium allomyrinae]
MTNDPTTDDVAQALAEYERLAIGTGARVGFGAPEFAAADGIWSQAWLPETPPVAARAVVTRDGAATTVVRLWRDALPADDAWRALWEQRPMPLFGAYVRRDAIRRAFRDVIGDRREPDEVAPPVKAPAPRDFAKELRGTESAVEVDVLFTAAQKAGAMTPTLETAFRKAHAAHRIADALVIEPADPQPLRISRAANLPTPRPPAPHVPKLTDAGKPVTRKGQSRAQRDTGKRHGGRS